jgi:hypothetical protein
MCYDNIHHQISSHIGHKPSLLAVSMVMIILFYHLLCGTQ